MTTLVSNRYLTIFILMLVLTIPFLGRGLYETSEGRYARVAQKMNLDHNYWMPKLNGKDHLTKPPLTYWTIATGLSLFGNNTAGARIFHSIAWIILGLIIVKIGSLLEGPRLGLIAGLIFATGLLPSLGSWGLTTDQLLVFFQAAALLAFLEYQKEGKRWCALLFWLMTGLALLTKGPVAVIPLIFWFFFWRDTFKSLIKTHLWPVSIFIGLSWYIGLELKYPGIISRLIKDELILRSTTDISGRNPFWWAPFIVYLLPFFFGWGLWPVISGSGSIREMRQRFPSHWTTLMMIWIALSLLLFSLIQSRLTLYILPLSVPAALILAYVIQDSKHILTVCAINALLVFAIKGYGTFLHQSDDDSFRISQFMGQHAEKAKVYSLWEKSLFGVEFYLEDKYEKVIRPREFSFPPQTSFWVMYQKKRERFFRELCESKHLEAKEKKSMGKWQLVQVSPHSLHKKKHAVISSKE